jgi:hypothetical protein
MMSYYEYNYYFVIQIDEAFINEYFIHKPEVSGYILEF